ncbi:MAG TPA: phytoene desaturase family protein [Candidatus Baltobacteraceae bacterium]|nr:phytoene desaturase family protein [Candidatus Baltobacteraceae bacterium]
MKLQSQTQRVVVAGAGVAGLTAAALLARSGFAVTLLEKNSYPGGRAAQLQLDGFRFDLGPTLLFMPDVFRKAFAQCGADFDREVPCTRLDPNYRLHFPGGRMLEISGSLPQTLESLERFEAGSSAGLLRYLAGAAQAYELSRRHFVGKRIRSAFEFLRPATMGALIRSGAFRSLATTAQRAFKSNDVAAALSFQSMYLGMSPFASPELYRLLFFTEMGEGIFFPAGGIGALVRALESLAVANGVEIEYGTPVTGLERNERRITAVLSGTSRFDCDAVVMTADLPYVYNRLLGEARHRSVRMQLTPSALLLYVALEERYPDLAHHEFLMPGDLRGVCSDIFERGVFPRDPAIYIAAPGATDPSMAPPGKEALYVLVPAPNLRGGIDWQGQAPSLAQHILAIVERRRLPGLRSRIRWMRTRTPLDFETELNLHGGAAFGLSHGLTQIGPLRPDTRHKRYRNLYFAGASTRPATGLPLVTMSAMQTADRIREDFAA